MPFNIYVLVKFLHVAAAISLFCAWAFEWLLLLLYIKSYAVINETIGKKLKKIVRLQTISVIIVIASGLWMGFTSWKDASWIDTAIIAIVIMEVIAKIIGRFAKAYEKRTGAAKEHPFVMNPLFARLMLRVRTSIASAIVAIMTIKPSTPLAGIAIIITAVLIAWLWSLKDIKSVMLLQKRLTER